MRSEAAPRVLLVGAGGIGAPFLLTLGKAGASLHLSVADDDVVELSNLHRQVLFSDADVGRPKLDALSDAARTVAPSIVFEAIRSRLLPDNAIELVSKADLVVDASDNFATRFLVADACAIAERPVVHAAAVRWTATVLGVSASGRPCYRCLFEDLPEGPAPDCATAGVAGPVCGVSGAIAADLALRMLAGDWSATGAIHTYDGLRDRLRRVVVSPRARCALCGGSRTITAIDSGRYDAAACSA
ncbi:MAG: HesA/MoeB/ThiF family protein [Polyangiaceae bacterium]|nr:HesA/MoeB/ThiF family protein [Polyangiaceae bacterium]